MEHAAEPRAPPQVPAAHGPGARHRRRSARAKKICPSISAWATDIVPGRVDWARKTANANGVEIYCVVADMFDGLGRRFDLVLCNPLAIPSRELEELRYCLHEVPGIGWS